MLQRIIAVLALLVGSSSVVSAQEKRPAALMAGDALVSADPRLVIEQFAAAPDIVHPIALDFDAKGRLLVVESHTHFRPAKYDGPKFDRIRMFEDTNGDGRADTITTFFEGTTYTMDLAVHPDGSVYVATRNEILRLRDTNGDDKADEKTRVVFLDTKGNYPHNGLSGLSFDSRGDLNFGMGENLGASYTLTGSDGVMLTGGGEGGNVYHCTADGKKLRRVATGFWNPFGSCRDIFGRLFVVDNDPDSSPPCRLVHVVEGGDYGFQFRYGRAGRHPFQAWNGELPGTLPYVAGTGESPCEVISYESDGLPSEYRGELLVPAWADHRVERYTLKPKGASFTAERKPFIQGGKGFYPSGLTIAPDGSLFVSDWGSRSYELHGKGAIWHIRWKDAKPLKRPMDPKEAIHSADRKTREAAARELAKDDAGCPFLRKQFDSKDVRIRAAALTALIDIDDPKTNLWRIALGDRIDPSGERSVGIRAMAVRALVALDADVTLLQDAGAPGVLVETFAAVRYKAEGGLFSQALGYTHPAIAKNDPFLRHAATQRLAAIPALLRRIDLAKQDDPLLRASVVLAWRASGLKDATKALGDFLKDPDPDVRFLAVKWVSDEKLVEFRPQIAAMLKRPDLDPRAFIGLSTTLARLEGKPVNEDSLATYFLDRLNDHRAPLSARLLALRAIPATHKALRTDFLIGLLQQDEASFRLEVLRALKDGADPKASDVVRAIARDTKQSTVVRAQAIVTLSAMNGADADFLISIASDPDEAIRHEALRGLNQTKLSPNQQEQLRIAIKGRNDTSDLVKRLFGKPFTASRPDAKNAEAWLKKLDGPADPEAGRRIFEHPKLAGCFRCHQVDGRGANVGPDLSLIGRTERRWIVESILQPSAVVAPHYQTWKVVTTDERTQTGLLVRTNLDESEYLDEKGNRFKVLATDVAEINAANVSIMPDGLLDGLTDQEIRDLVAFLESRK